MENEINKIWLDNCELYRFFRDRKIDELDKKHCIGYLPPYVITREALGSDDRKKRIRLLAAFMGYEYAQSLEYLHFSLERFLRTSMPINRLSSLINETFFYFERYMYMKLDWEKGKSSFYRDHAFHPAGESFLGYELLQLNPQLENKFIDFLIGNSSITHYILDNCRIGLTPENLVPLIYRTWFLASLFHDLGYVLSFYRTHRSQMLSFQRYSDLIFRSNRSSFDDIQLLLSNSLLFNTVDHSILEDCYNRNHHGTYSSFLLLATFYSPPAFDHVDNIDRAAIELAARAIFFHDWPSEADVDFIDGEKNTSNTKKSKTRDVVFGDYSKRFKTISRNSKVEEKKNFFDDLSRYFKKKNRPELHRLFHIDLNIPKSKRVTGYKQRRDVFKRDPFAFYLRFIDELHVFGRNSLVTSTECDDGNRAEIYASYEMPKTRNLVPFPAQFIRYNKNNDKLEVFYCADDYLFSKNIKGQNEENKFFNSNYETEDRAWSKYLLNELFWLKQCGEKSGLFNEIDFYFAGILPKKY